MSIIVPEMWYCFLFTTLGWRSDEGSTKGFYFISCYLMPLNGSGSQYEGSSICRVYLLSLLSGTREMSTEGSRIHFAIGLEQDFIYYPNSVSPFSKEEPTVAFEGLQKLALY